jgi:hypothetical protein
LNAGVERAFRLHISGRPSPPALAPCVDWPSEATLSGAWTPHTAGGNRDSPLWRANVQYRITGVVQPVRVRLLLQVDDVDDARSIGVMVLRGAASSRALVLDAETEVACSAFVYVCVLFDLM